MFLAAIVVLLLVGVQQLVSNFGVSTQGLAFSQIHPLNLELDQSFFFFLS